MSHFAEISALVLALVGIYQLHRFHHAVRAAHPPLDYETHSTAVADSWRWREPPQALGLTIENDQVASRIVLPFRHTAVEILTSLVGYFLLAVLGSIVLLSFLDPGVGGVALLFPVLFFGALIWALLNTDSHLRAIELRRDEVRFAMQYGIFLQRHIVLRSYPGRLIFTGGYQSMFTMNRGQHAPDFKLIVKKTCCWLFSRKKGFYLLCNQSQGSWMVGGLNAWVNRVDGSQNQ